MNLRILLLQARKPDDKAREEERCSFAEMSSLELENIVPYDLLSGTPSLNEVQSYDALMVGGSGDYYVSKRNLPGFSEVLDLLSEVISTGHPMFASCFGFQLMVQALGGEIVYDPDHMEVGTYRLNLTDAGAEDELFSSLPASFLAQLGHKDRADHIPDSVVNLASSRNSQYQAIRIPNKPIWATQFHPELNRDENLRRFHRYLDGYAPMMGDTEIEETLARFKESPATENLLEGFIDIVFG